MDGTEILAVAVYVPLLLAAAVAVWRRPVLALYLFVFGLAVHNLVMASLYEAGVRGLTLDAIAAWKEILLAVALLAVCVRARGLPFRPQLVDALALAFAAVVVVYAVLPQSVLGGEASAEGVLQGLRHAIVPVLAYALGRSLGLGSQRASPPRVRGRRRRGAAGGRRDRGAVHGSARLVARLGRAGLVPGPARLRLPGRWACQVRCSTWARATTRAGSCAQSFLSPRA